MEFDASQSSQNAEMGGSLIADFETFWLDL
jgi:hypothetical protein